MISRVVLEPGQTLTIDAACTVEFASYDTYQQNGDTPVPAIELSVTGTGAALSDVTPVSACAEHAAEMLEDDPE